MKLLPLLFIFLLGDARAVPVVIEPYVCNIDYESLRETLRICECSGIEIPACKMSLHYCKVFKNIKKFPCHFDNNLFDKNEK